LVEDKTVAGLVTLVERHGKVVDFTPGANWMCARRTPCKGFDLPHLFHD